MVENRLVNDGTQVQSLTQEDPTGHGAAEPVTATTEPVLQGPEAASPEPTHPGARDLQQEKPASEKAGSAPGEQPLPPQLEGPAQPKINKTRLKNITVHRAVISAEPHVQKGQASWSSRC